MQVFLFISDCYTAPCEPNFTSTDSVFGQPIDYVKTNVTTDRKYMK